MRLGLEQLRDDLSTLLRDAEGLLGEADPGLIVIAYRTAQRDAKRRLDLILASDAGRDEQSEAQVIGFGSVLSPDQRDRLAEVFGDDGMKRLNL
jgi:hypothetical protein